MIENKENEKYLTKRNKYAFKMKEKYMKENLKLLVNGEFKMKENYGKEEK